jgi:hypothetical protein
MHHGTAALGRDDGRGDDRSPGLDGAALECHEPSRRDMHVVVDEDRERGRDVLHREVAGLVGRQVTVDPKEVEVVGRREPLELTLDPSRRAGVDDPHPGAVLAVPAHIGHARDGAGERFARDHDDRGGRRGFRPAVGSAHRRILADAADTSQTTG